VPYVRCASCGLTTFVVRSRAWAPLCPRCDRVLSGASGEDAPGGRTIDETVELTRQLLQMDVAMVTEIDASHEVARHVAGEWPGIGSLAGGALPLEETFCKRMLEGEIENYVADVAGDDRVNDLQFAKALGVGAWIGVPLPASLGRLYVLCCLAREARELGERDVHVLRGLAVTLSAQLDEPAGGAA
jgi:GAF domain-containing protein